MESQNQQAGEVAREEACEELSPSEALAKYADGGEFRAHFRSGLMIVEWVQGGTPHEIGAKGMEDALSIAAHYAYAIDLEARLRKAKHGEAQPETKENGPVHEDARYEALGRSVSELGLSIRAVNRLREKGFLYVGDLAGVDPKRLRLPGLGARSRRDIAQALSRALPEGAPSEVVAYWRRHLRRRLH